MNIASPTHNSTDYAPVAYSPVTSSTPSWISTITCDQKCASNIWTTTSGTLLTPTYPHVDSSRNYSALNWWDYFTITMEFTGVSP